MRSFSRRHKASILLFPLALMSFLLAPQKHIRVYLIGDSTMSDKEVKAYPETGWGMPFAHFFDQTVTVDNRAKNGRSTKSFIAEKRWQAVADSLQEGDYVFIQFGHNDEVPTKATYTPEADYRANLLRFITESRSRGAIPVLITPVGRRKFDAAGNIQETHAAYAAIVREVAAAQEVPLIDLDKESQALIQQFGPDRSKLLFDYVAPGENPNYPEGKQDDTHFNELGARRMAEIVLANIRALKLALADRIVKGADKPEADVKAPAPKTPATYPTSFTVAKDGSGDFKTIQEAINAVRDLSQVQVKIYIRKGIYHEKLVVPSWKTNISLEGENADSTIITNDDYSGKAWPCGQDPSGKDKFNTFTSYTLLVQGNDFSAENLTIQNTAGRVGQAVALHVEGDRCRITHCRLLGSQDTLYAAKEDSRQLYTGCYIEGTTDFIFGEATAVFKQCVIRSLTNSFITAASTRPGRPFGFVFLDCRLVADTAVVHKVYLGRPWRPYANVVYIRTEMGSQIVPAGWENWRNPENERTAFFAEYGSTGPGAGLRGAGSPTGPGIPAGGRVSWSRQLSAKEARKYTINNILSGGDKWQP